MSKAENRELSLAQTVTLACDLENSLIVRKIFEHFTAPAEGVKASIKQMHSEAEQHHRRVLATLAHGSTN